MYLLLIGLIGLFGVLANFADYSSSIRQWQVQRNAKLRQPDSWLTLVGLFWLKPGDNTIGSGEDNDFVLPPGSAPKHSGVLRLAGDEVTFRGKTLSADEKKPEVVRTGSITFYVIKRGDRFGIRAKNSQSETLKNFKGLEYFPVNASLHFQANFIKDPRKIPILNVLGQTEVQQSPGVVEFAYQGKTYRLRPIFEDQTLFFLFKDSTNKTRTYQAGRMLNTALPVDGQVDLDFNRSYNPPCTFTPYATCPLPPKENRLPFAVEAGELRYKQSHAEFSAAR